jgi:hypothetical protein
LKPAPIVKKLNPYEQAIKDREREAAEKEAAQKIKQQ